MSDTSIKSKIVRNIYVIALVCILVGSVGHFFEQKPFKYIFLLALIVILNHLWIMYKPGTGFQAKKATEDQSVFKFITGCSSIFNV